MVDMGTSIQVIKVWIKTFYITDVAWGSDSASVEERSSRFSLKM